MTLSIEDIKKIAHLARIDVSDSEASATLTKLTGIMTLIEQMQAVDTQGITPMSHSQDVVQRLREDVVTKTNQREAFQKVALCWVTVLQNWPLMAVFILFPK